MSSEEDNQEIVAVKKKYKLWKNDNTIPVPLRTIQRWENNTTHGFHSKNDDDLETAGTSHDNVNDSDRENDNCSDFADTTNSDDDNTDASSNASIDMERDIHNTSASNQNDENPDEDDNEEDNDRGGLNDFDVHAFSSSLYETSTVSVDDSVLSLLNLYVQHKWTKASLQDTLKMLHRILPKENNMPKTVFKLFQYVEKSSPPFSVVRHFYCKKCVCYIGIDSKIDKCFSFNGDKKNISFFFEIDIREQIKYMFEKQNLAEKLKKWPSHNDENIISDITDGSEYIRVNSRPNRGKYDLTLMLNTDGLALVASSKSHCWPLVFLITELPEHLRESFLITIGIWYDDECKPSMNTFLRPFCAKLRECFHDGINWVNPKTGETAVSRIVAPLIIADAPARAQVQNILNFNGRYGCNICEIKMKRPRRIEGKRSCRIYPYSDEDNKLRTGRIMIIQAQKVLDLNKKHVKGVKGSSVISGLPFLDLGTCLLPEYMHSVLLGVGRQFVDLWIAKQGRWNIKQDIKEIDSFMLSIQRPYFFHRMPRQISLSKFYKAYEYYNFILFYSLPALVKFLPNEYLQHWVLLVKALFILLQERIRKSPDLEEAERLLKLFVKETKTLYGDRQLSYNLHQLLHLVLVVKRWGPLWATSAFPFENFNGFLAHCVHGTKHLGQEMVNNLRIAQGIKALNYRATARNIAHSSVDESKPQLVGKSITFEFNNLETELLASHEINFENLRVYTRAIIDHESYTSQQYKTIKTNSYTVQVHFIDNSTTYGKIRFFFQTEGDVVCFVLDCFTIEHTRIFHHSETKARVDHIVPVKGGNSSLLLLVKSNMIKLMYHLIRVGDYICKRPNRFRKVF